MLALFGCSLATKYTVHFYSRPRDNILHMGRVEGSCSTRQAPIQLVVFAASCYSQESDHVVDDTIIGQRTPVAGIFAVKHSMKEVLSALGVILAILHQLIAQLSQVFDIFPVLIFFFSVKSGQEAGSSNPGARLGEYVDHGIYERMHLFCVEGVEAIVH